ncbi:uncharacterized protein LOC143034223 [Oratosquilla oratoria]|uniref:uncharacterized protein LOC143034223 n=1 Tax=Oratosquilla oratoria TaxID=337810 RepID=UPI003F75D032
MAHITALIFVQTATEDLRRAAEDRPKRQGTGASLGSDAQRTSDRPFFEEGSVGAARPTVGKRTRYSLKSAAEFIDILSTSDPDEDIASLDVESLFTHVPTQETIEIILDYFYRSGRIPLSIPERLLKEILEAYTMEALFLSHRREIFRQVDGVAMGSSLGVLFANMYMVAVETRTFNSHHRPRIYARYIDDIFISIRESSETMKLADTLKANSVLNFTIKESKDKTLPLLDVFVEKKEDHYATSVFTKDTNVVRCLNARGVSRLL